MKKRMGESGNIFFTLFGAVALVGVVGAATSTLMRGPVGTVVALNQRAKADSQMQIAMKLAMLEAQNNSNDCDPNTPVIGDGFIEPVGFAAGAVPGNLTGGGRLPSVGSTSNDPWGSPYGYCAWDHGVITGSGCSGGGPLLTGSPTGQGTVIAVLSAGPDRLFGLTCANAPAPNAPYITRGANGADDLIVSMTYAEANEASGGLWSIKSGEPDKITTNRELDVSTGAQFSGNNVNFSNPVTSFAKDSKLDLTAGSLFMLPDDSDLNNLQCDGALATTNAGILRRKVSGGGGQILQICDPSDPDPVDNQWADIGGAGAIVAAAGNPNEIQFNNAGSMGASSSLIFNSSSGLTVGGDSIFSSDLRVNQTLRVNNALNVTGATTLTGALDVDGAADFDSTIDVAMGATFGSWLRGSDGTSGAPTYSFTGDSDSGLFFSSSALRFSVDGTERMALSAGGLTMIAGHSLGNFTVDGTLTTNDLSVNNNITANRFISRMATTSAAQPGFETEPGTGMYSAVDNTLSLTVGGTPRIVIDGTIAGGPPRIVVGPTGDVGIGVVTPDAKLDVGGEIKVGTSSLGCGPTLHGAIRYVSGDLLQVCSSVTGIWEDIGTSGGGGGGAASYWTRISTVDKRLYYDDAFVGVGTSDPLTNFHVAGDLLVTGTYTGTASAPTSGGGTRMFFDPESGAFRAGTVTGNQWDSAFIGSQASIGLGADAMASGPGSISIGTSVRAYSDYSFAMGLRANVSGQRSAALGLGNAAGTYPVVSAAQSYGIFMGDQSDVNLAQGNTMALLGGRFLIDQTPALSPAVSGTLSLDVEGGVGAMQYCDENGVNCFTAASVATGGVTAPGNNRELIYNSGGVLGANPNMVFSSAGNLTLGGTGAIALPTGDNTNRPVASADGMLRYNTGLGRFEGFQGGQWRDLVTGTALAAGANTQIQFNSNGSFGAVPAFTFSQGEMRVDGTDYSRGGVMRIRGAETVPANYLDATMILESTASGSLWSQTLVSNIPARNGDLVFAHYNGSTWAEPLILADDGRIGIFSANPRASLDINTTDAILLPVGSIANRPMTSIDGMLRYNSQTGKFEGHQGGTWQDILTSAVVGGAASPNRGVQFNSNGSFAASTNFQYTSGGSLLLSGTHSGTSDASLPTGAGTRIFFDPGKSAFRAGGVDAAEWDFGNVGNYSTATGSNTQALGYASVAMGSGTTASNTASVALGSSTTASGQGSIAAGASAIASGTHSMALGVGTSASGEASYAGGSYTIASGAHGIAMGRNVIAGDNAPGSGFGDGSFALGLVDDAVSITTTPRIHGIQSMGIFMGDQSGRIMTASNTMGLFGGRMVIDPRVPAQQLSARGVIDVGAATDAIVLPIGSNTNRPAGIDGMIRYNSQSNRFEGHQAGVWQDLVTIGTVPGASAPNRGIQFNSGGNFAASNYFLWNDSIWNLQIGDIADSLPEVMIGRTADDAHLRLQGQHGQNNALISMVSNTTSNLWQMTMKGDSTANPDALAFENYHDADNSWHGPIVFAGSNNLARIGINTYNPNVSLDIRATDAIQLPSGSTAQRPTAWEANGMLRYNSQTNKFEGFQNGSWQDILTSAVAGGAASPNRGIQFNSGGNFAAIGDLQYTSAGALLLSGTYTGAGTEPVSGAGTRMFFDPGKAAFRAGRVTGSQWNFTSVGNYSTAFGLNTIASGDISIAMGSGAIASGNYSTALGAVTTASGLYATAAGQGAIASGQASVAMGSGSTASGHFSTAMGALTTASGSHSTAMGNTTIASGNSSAAIGMNTTASGDSSFAMGWLSTATGNFSAAIGLSATAGGLASFALGQGAAARGDGSMATGLGTIASGQASTAMGRHVVAGNGTAGSGFGDGSMALGLIDDAVTITVPSQVHGIQSMGVFMGDQDGLIMYASNTMGVFGGQLVIDPRVPAQQLSARGVIDVGAATDAIVLPSGSTAQQPVGVNGMLRYNSQTNKFEGFQANSWQDIVTGAASSSFISLTDTPSSYAGQANKFVRVNAGTTALEFTDQIVPSVSGQPAPTGTILDDLADVTVATPTAGQILTYSSGQWINAEIPVTPTLPAGTNTQLQFNSNGSFGAVSNLTWNIGTTTLGVTGRINVSDRINIAGQAGNAPIGTSLSNLSDVTVTAPSAGQILTYSGGRWINVTNSGGAPASPNRGIQFNSAGSFAATGDLQYTSAGTLLITGTFTGAGTEPVAGAGTRMFFDPVKSAFRAGRVTAGQWNYTSVGIYSTAMGYNTTAIGDGSTALGGATVASGSVSTAMGSGTTASGSSSTAMGYNTTADFIASTAMGYATIANSVASTAMGSFTTASGDSSTAMGRNTIASGQYSTAMGHYTIASGIASTAMGRYVAAGNGTPGFGDGSLAIGLIDDAVTITTASQVRGIQSMGVFMGDQDGLIMYASNTMGVFGGQLVIDPRVPAQQLSARGVIDVGAATDAIVLPSGSTAQQPAGVNGMLRYNSQTNKFEGFQANSWQDIVTGAASSSFISLTDTPSSYAGQANKFVRVNAGTTALEFTDQIVPSMSGQPAPTGTILDDLADVTVATPTAGQILTYSSGQWINAEIPVTPTLPAGTDTQIQFNNSGTFGASGNLTWNGTTFAVVGDVTYTGTITDVSDMRLKNNILPLKDRGSMLGKLDQIGTYSFTMKDDKKGQVEFGVMAQEINKVFPELVKIDENSAEKYMSVNYVGLIAPLIEASKELKAENESLKTQISTIEERMASLEGDMNGMKAHTGYGISKAQMGLGMILGMMLMGGMAGVAMIVVNRRRRQG